MKKSKQHQKDRNLQALGEAVRIQRLQLGLSQEELGERAALHRTYVTDIESGLRNMSLLTLIKVTRALTLPLSQLIMEAENIDGWKIDGDEFHGDGHRRRSTRDGDGKVEKRGDGRSVE